MVRRTRFVLLAFSNPLTPESQLVVEYRDGDTKCIQGMAEAIPIGSVWYSWLSLSHEVQDTGFP